MRTASYLTLAALGTALCVAGALTSSNRAPAQAPPPNLPASTVYGRLGISAGPGQAIPFATLLSNLFNGTPAFTPHSVLIGQGSSPITGATTGTAGQLLIDQGAAADPLFQPSSGDVTNTSAGVFTIAANVVTNAKLAQMAANGCKGNNTGGASNVLDLTPAQCQALLNVAQGQIVGTTTNDNANAGNIGEHIIATVPIGSAGSISSATPANVTSISLTAGDWDISATGYFIGAAATNITRWIVCIGTTSATLNSTAQQYAEVNYPGGVVPGTGVNITASVPTTRVSLATTTTVFIIVQGTFTVSTATAWGGISARRRR